MKLKLESKFIKDTNKQYSIREDGAVISHYRFNYWSSENKNYKIVKLLEKVNITFCDTDRLSILSSMGV